LIKLTDLVGFLNFLVLLTFTDELTLVGEFKLLYIYAK